jgi:hypothetical protein
MHDNDTSAKFAAPSCLITCALAVSTGGNHGDVGHVPVTSTRQPAEGNVTDPQGQPFLGATVAIDGNIETKTAEDGAHIWTCWKPEHTS